MHSSANNGRKSLAVIGSGGVIGSNLVGYLGRMETIGKLILVDHDSYEDANLATQDITTEDTERLKVVVQAERLDRINPSLPVVPIAAPVERVPRGALRSDVILTCLDSRRARQHVNAIAWRLGVPWIDSGVEGGSRLARINTYLPGEDQPCLECAFGEADYEALEQEYRCGARDLTAYPTGAPSSLGALAASLQALELTELLDGRLERSAFGRQVVLAANHHKVYVTTFRRNPDCRLADHGVWKIEKLERGPAELTIADALRLGPEGTRSDPDHGLRVEGSMFVSRLFCPGCRRARPLFRLEASLGLEDSRCDRCGATMVAGGFDKVERVNPDTTRTLSPRRSLASIGLRRGDIISVGVPGNEMHSEIGGLPR